MDAYIAEIIVVINEAYEERLPEAVAMLKNAGMNVVDVDNDNAVVKGDIDVTKLPDLRKLPAVGYVRQVFRYEAEYPPGDPRDVDGV